MTRHTTVGATMDLRRHLGFTLVEIAISLAIVGIVAAMGLALLSAQQIQQQLSTTKAHQEIIRLAILGFVARNNRLPCPADPGINAGAPSYGVEAATPGTPGCTGAIHIPTAAPTARKGIIPWVTLGLTQEVATDGFRGYYTYIVTDAATSTTASTLTQLQGGIALYSSSPVHPGLPKAATSQNQINACTDTPLGTPSDDSCNLLAVAALISHGKNGYGSYNPGAGSTTTAFPTIPNLNEVENANNDVALVDTGVFDPVEGGFDDMLVVWNPHDILNTLAFPGFIKSPRAVTNDRLAAAKRSLISYVVANAFKAPNGAISSIAGTQSGATNGEDAVAATPDTPPTCTSCLPWSTLGLDAAASFDGWGTLMRYAVHTNVATTGGGLKMSTPNAVYKNAFVVISAGPNRTFETTPADQTQPLNSDDITVSVTLGELRGMMMQLGLVVPP